MSPTSYRTAPPRGDRFHYDGPGFAPAYAEKGALMSPTLLADRIPKVHLHCHLEGTVRAQTFVELARKYDVPLRYRPSSFDSAPSGRFAQDDKVGGRFAQDDNAYEFSGIQEFLYLFAAVSRSLKEPEDYARMAREFVEDALTQNVMYGELFVSPSVWTFFHPALDVRATMEAIVGELRAAQPNATFALLPDLTRNFGTASAMRTAQAMVEMTDLDVIGISLGGDEVRFPAELFAGVFSYAHSEGLHCVAHAGEAGGAESVLAAVEQLGAERIGHGIAALEDERVAGLLAEQRIALEICPTSNRLTEAARPKYPHPYLDFEDRGCIVTIDADDPALFRTSITKEYAEVERVGGSAMLEQFVRNAVEASFAPAEAKRAMCERLDGAIAELGEQSRS
jgi:aminodeoxyfutalosine deaminase